MTMIDVEYQVHFRTPHQKQREILESPAKRRVIRAGRRGGKTTVAGALAVMEFIQGGRVFYATPTAKQIRRFWGEVKRALSPLVDAGLFYKNETEHIIELANTDQSITAQTGYNADTLRGDYCTLLILDEFQLMHEEVWGEVGAPMLLDTDGSAVFIYTPPSLHSIARTQARDPRHAAKLYQRAEEDTTGRWQTFHFSSLDNPHLSTTALAEITGDMTALAYEQEILALDKDEDPRALWTRDMIEDHRLSSLQSGVQLVRVITGIDPPGGRAECGIVTVGIGDNDHLYVLSDDSLYGTPKVWGEAAIAAYHIHKADKLVAEINYGGDMVENVIDSIDKNGLVNFGTVRATRGKAIRAEPCAARYEQGKGHHVGHFPLLEDELCQWVPGRGKSPNRLDAAVWAMTDLMYGGLAMEWFDNPLKDYRG